MAAAICTVEIRTAIFGIESIAERGPGNQPLLVEGGALLSAHAFRWKRDDDGTSPLFVFVRMVRCRYRRLRGAWQLLT